MIYIGRRRGAHEKFEQNNTLNFSREDLANMVGTSTESLIRTLSELKNEKIIEITGRDIKILNVQGLERIKKFSCLGRSLLNIIHSW